MDKKSIKILLIEDDSDDAFLFGEMLEKAKEKNVSYALTTTESLSEAFELLTKQEFNLIITDLGLPDSQGIETLISLKKQVPEIPIVVLTNLNEETAGAEAVQSGAQDYLVKGYLTSFWLAHSIRYALERHNLQKQIDQMKEEFVTTITHDLKSPVTSIIGFAELLANPAYGEISPRKMHFLRIIKHAAELLLGLINNILSASKIEAGKMTYNFTTFKLDELLHELIEVFEPQLIQKGINCQSLCKEDLCVYADRFWTRQVFYNLLSNAIKFTPQGGSITILATPKEDRVAVEVRDTGQGIPDSEKGKLFQKYSQVQGDRRGTGLGLYIVKHILAGHNSQVTMESEMGKGSSFYFDLPMQKCSEKTEIIA